jgi:hypothetical protein
MSDDNKQMDLSAEDKEILANMDLIENMELLENLDEVESLQEAHEEIK